MNKLNYSAISPKAVVDIHCNFRSFDGSISDVRVGKKLAQAYLMFGAFSVTVGGQVLWYQPIVKHLGCGVYQCTAKRM